MDNIKSRIIVITHPLQIAHLPEEYFGIIAAHGSISKETIQRRMKLHQPHQQYVIFEELIRPIVSTAEATSPEARSSYDNSNNSSLNYTSLIRLAKKTCVLIFTFFEEETEGNCCPYWWQQDASIYAHAIVAGVHESVLIRPLLKASEQSGGGGCITAFWVSTYELAVQLKTTLGQTKVPVVEIQYFEDNVRMVEKRFDTLRPVQLLVVTQRKTAIHPKLHFGTIAAKSHVIWNRDQLWTHHKNDRLFPWQFSSDALIRASPGGIRSLQTLASVREGQGEKPWVKTPIVRLKKTVTEAILQILNCPAVVCTSTEPKLVKNLLPMLAQVGILGRAIQEDRIRKDLEHTITRTVQCTLTLEESDSYHRLITIILVSRRSSKNAESTVSTPPISSTASTSCSRIKLDMPSSPKASTLPLLDDLSPALPSENKGRNLLGPRVSRIDRRATSLESKSQPSTLGSSFFSLPTMECPTLDAALGLQDICNCLQLSYSVILGQNLRLDPDFVEQMDLISPSLSGFILAASKCNACEMPATMVRSVGIFDFRWVQAKPLSVLLSFIQRWSYARREYKRQMLKRSSSAATLQREMDLALLLSEKPLSSFMMRLEMSKAHCVLYRSANELMRYAAACSDPPGRFPMLEGVPKTAKRQLAALLICGSIFSLLAFFSSSSFRPSVPIKNSQSSGTLHINIRAIMGGFQSPVHEGKIVAVANGILGSVTALSTWVVTDAVRTMFAVWVGDGMAKSGASAWSWLTSVRMRLEERVTLLYHCANTPTRRAAQTSLAIWICLTLFEVLGRTVILAQLTGENEDEAIVIINTMGCALIALACLFCACIIVWQCLFYHGCWWWEGSLWQLISTSQPTASGNSCIVRGGCAPGSWWTFSGRVITFRDVQKYQNVGHLNLQVHDSPDDPRLDVNWPADVPGRCYGGG